MKPIEDYTRDELESELRSLQWSNRDSEQRERGLTALVRLLLTMLMDTTDLDDCEQRKQIALHYHVVSEEFHPGLHAMIETGVDKLLRAEYLARMRAARGVGDDREAKGRRRLDCMCPVCLDVMAADTAPMATKAAMDVDLSPHWNLPIVAALGETDPLSVPAIREWYEALLTGLFVILDDDYHNHPIMEALRNHEIPLDEIRVETESPGSLLSALLAAIR